MTDICTAAVADLIPAEERRALLANGARRSAGATFDPLPIVRLFTPNGQFSWLLTEIDPDDPDMAFGFCDYGDGTPFFAYIDIAALAELGRADAQSRRIERDPEFRVRAPISVYAAEAQASGRIRA